LLLRLGLCKQQAKKSGSAHNKFKPAASRLQRGGVKSKPRSGRLPAATGTQQSSIVNSHVIYSSNQSIPFQSCNLGQSNQMAPGGTQHSDYSAGRGRGGTGAVPKRYFKPFHGPLKAIFFIYSYFIFLF